MPRNLISGPGKALRPAGNPFRGPPLADSGAEKGTGPRRKSIRRRSCGRGGAHPIPGEARPLRGRGRPIWGEGFPHLGKGGSPLGGGRPPFGAVGALFRGRLALSGARDVPDRGGSRPIRGERRPIAGECRPIWGVPGYGSGPVARPSLRRGRRSARLGNRRPMLPSPSRLAPPAGPPRSEVSPCSTVSRTSSRTSSGI